LLAGISALAPTGASKARDFDFTHLTDFAQTMSVKVSRRRPKCSAAPTMQWIYSSVSKASLQKTGVLLNTAGAFREFSPKKSKMAQTETFNN
jgi:hypothetical protein